MELQGSTVKYNTKI